jgi:APA family basic amino acid/polyamine antiporter
MTYLDCVFGSAGVAARGREAPDGSFDGAGPSVIVSFAISSVVALLCALCYTEFATAVPVAGGAYVYVTVTFGELAAWMVGTNLLLEYTLSAAAVARGWTSYLAETLQMEPSALRIQLEGAPITCLHGMVAILER